ncbi:hypothetical protein [Rhizomonospora bruguierae]|uniref:hypothetical protein n=1 Tax=Rhizomonospora bruguierae TaxID=1581705 RepID=UPI001BD05D32|nr:hypothetical protein [Micromonospora sp. NBRC 107566]
MNKWLYRTVGTVGLAGGALLIAGQAAQADAPRPGTDPQQLRALVDGLLAPIGDVHLGAAQLGLPADQAPQVMFASQEASTIAGSTLEAPALPGLPDLGGLPDPRDLPISDLTAALGALPAGGLGLLAATDGSDHGNDRGGVRSSGLHGVNPAADILPMPAGQQAGLTPLPLDSSVPLDTLPLADVPLIADELAQPLGGLLPTDGLPSRDTGITPLDPQWPLHDLVTVPPVNTTALPSASLPLPSGADLGDLRTPSASPPSAGHPAPDRTLPRGAERPVAGEDTQFTESGTPWATILPLDGLPVLPALDDPGTIKLI